MQNKDVLLQKITESGLKISYICNTLGVSTTCFYNRLNGKSDFRGSEIFVLVTLLHLSDEEKRTIFFPNEVEKTFNGVANE